MIKRKVGGRIFDITAVDNVIQIKGVFTCNSYMHCTYKGTCNYTFYYFAALF